MKMQSSIWAAAATIVAGAACIQPASAQVVLTLQDTTGGVAVTCNTMTPRSAVNCGAGFAVTSSRRVTFSGTVGRLTIAGLVATSNAPGSATDGKLSLLYGVMNPTSTARQLFVDFTGFDFNAPSAADLRSAGGITVTRWAPVVHVFTLNTYADPTNSAFLRNPANCSVGSPTTGCTTETAWTRGSGSYSLRLIETGFVGRGSNLSVNTRLDALPR